VSADLVRDLELLELDWPETPDLAPAVLARLDEEPRPARPRRRRRLVIVVALLVLIPAAGAVAFPGARDDVLDWLGLRSVEVERVDRAPSAPPAAPDEFGDVVPVEEAGRRAGFDVLLPPRLGKPGEVRERDGIVTLDYGDLRLQQRRGALERALLRKIVGPGGQVRRVPGGIFITGRHEYLFLDEDGQVVSDRTRSAGNTLIVARGDLLLRLEGDATLTYERARGLI
jgi:hypothetical protein